MCVQNNLTTRLRIRVANVRSLLILASHCNYFSNKTVIYLRRVLAVSSLKFCLVFVRVERYRPGFFQLPSRKYVRFASKYVSTSDASWLYSPPQRPFLFRKASKTQRCRYYSILPIRDPVARVSLCKAGSYGLRRIRSVHHAK